MIDKSLIPPASSCYALQFPLSALKKGGNVGGVHLAHMKEEDGALRCAEGVTQRYVNERSVVKLVVSKTEICALSNPRYAYMLLQGRRYQGPEYVNEVVNYYEKDGTEMPLFIGKKAVIRPTATGSAFVNRIGGTCGERHYERLYVGKEQKLYYSPPLSYDFWTYGPYQAGDITFTGQDGDILGIKSYHGKLYLFFERGISVFTAYGDPFSYKVESLPFGFVRNLYESFAICGGAIYFLTECGLCALDDSGVRLIEDADVGDIDLNEPVYASAYKRQYCAAVYDRNGRKVIYRYDCDTGRGSYIYQEYDCFGAGCGMYCSVGDRIYELTGRALPATGECALTVEFSLDNKSGAQYLESLEVAGEGKINVQLINRKGEKATATGECGKRLKLSRALGGESYTLKILPENEEFAIRGLSFAVRRYEA